MADFDQSQGSRVRTTVHFRDRATLVAGSIIVCLLLALYSAAYRPGWYIIPSVGTLLICTLAIARLPKTHFGLFDVRLITWLVVAYSQGLSFLLNVILNYYWSVTPIYYSEEQLREFTAVSATVSFAGAVIFFLVDSLVTRKTYQTVPRRSRYEVRPGRYKIVLGAFIVVSLAVQLYILFRFGGVSGYLRALTDNREAFDGFGILYLFSEPLPVLFMMIWACRHLTRGTTPSWQEVLAVFVVFLALKMAFGGLRGSRSNTVWGIFWFLCVVHVMFIRVRAAVLVSAGVLVLAFVVAYSAYKTYGYRLISGEVDIATAMETSGRYEGRPITGVLLEDFSRSGAQTLVVAEYLNNEQYVKRKGETYLGALMLLVPNSVFRAQPDTKIQAGSQLLYGTHYAATRDRGSSRIWGIFGEAVLNFGVVLAPFVIALFAIGYRAIYRAFASLHPRDPRMLAYPLAVNAIFIAIVSDSDNLVFFLVKNGTIPLLCLLLICRRIKRSIDHAV